MGGPSENGRAFFFFFFFFLGGGGGGIILTEYNVHHRLALSILTRIAMAAPVNRVGSWRCLLVSGNMNYEL